MPWSRVWATPKGAATLAKSAGVATACDEMLGGVLENDEETIKLETTINLLSVAHLRFFFFFEIYDNQTAGGLTNKFFQKMLLSH